MVMAWQDSGWRQAPSLVVAVATALALLTGAGVAARPALIALPLAIAVVAAMVALPRPSALVLAFLLPLLPIQLSVRLGGLPLVTASRGLVACALVAAVINVARGRLQPSGLWPLWFAVPWVGALFLSVHTSIDPSTSLDRAMSEVVEFLGIFLVFAMTFGPRDLRSPLRAFAAASVLNASIAVLEVVTGIRVAGVLGGAAGDLVSEGDVRFGFVRSQGLFQHPAMLATSLAMAAPILYALVLTERRERRWVPAAGLSVVVAGLAVTVTRAAWIAAAVGLAVVFVAGVHRRRGSWWHLYVVAAAVALALVLAPTTLRKAGSVVGDLTSTQGTATTQTSGYRLALLDRSLVASADSPYIGHGAGTFAELKLTTVWHGRILELSSPDSQFVRVLVEVGWIGVAAFGVMLLGVAVTGLVALRSATGSDGVLVLAVIAALLGFVFMNATISAYAIVQVGQTFWFLAALLCCAARRVGGP